VEKKQSAKYSNKEESIIAAVNGYKDDIRWRRIWLIAGFGAIYAPRRLSAHIYTTCARGSWYNC
jgi:hypothetical protein